MTAPVIDAVRVRLGPDEQAAAAAVLASGRLTQGEQVAAFEQEFAEAFGSTHAVAVNSGDERASHCTSRGRIGRGPGRRPLLLHLRCDGERGRGATGATPVFADVDAATFCLDPASASAAIGPRTAGIVPVHLFGQMAAMDEVTRLADRHGLFLLEDAAQAHAARSPRGYAGSVGAAGAFGFTLTKNLTTGEGGLITFQDPDLARRDARSATRAWRRATPTSCRPQQPDDRRAAAIGRVQVLRRLPGLNARRREVADAYRVGLSEGGGPDGIRLPVVADHNEHVYHHAAGARPRRPPGPSRAPRGPDQRLLPHSGPPAPGVRRGAGPAQDRRRVRRGVVVAHAPPPDRWGGGPRGRRRLQGEHPMTQLRAVLIGLGQMGRHHARALASLEGVDLVGVHDPALTETHPAAALLPMACSVDELLRDFPTSPSWRPRRPRTWVGRRLAAAGVHTLIEKPVAESRRGPRPRPGVRGHQRDRGGGPHRALQPRAAGRRRRRLDDGQIGEIYQVATRRTGPYPARIGDVGVALDLATHDIDLTAWVTRSAYRSVSAIRPTAPFAATRT